MKTPIRTTFAALALGAALAFPGAPTVSAAEPPFTAEQLDALLTDNTVYLDVPAGGPMGDGGETPIRFGADGRTQARLPTDASMVGEWRLEEARYCVDWDPAPKDSCTLIAREGGALLFVDADTGASRGTVMRIEPGDPEGFDG